MAEIALRSGLVVATVSVSSDTAHYFLLASCEWDEKDAHFLGLTYTERRRRPDCHSPSVATGCSAQPKALDSNAYCSLCGKFHAAATTSMTTCLPPLLPSIALALDCVRRFAICPLRQLSSLSYMFCRCRLLLRCKLLQVYSNIPDSEMEFVCARVEK
jgi:hypothetical protein